MSNPQGQDWLDKPANHRRIRIALYTVCAIVAALDLIVHRHIEIAVERVPAFYAVFGFVACVALVLVAKLMRRILMRREDYYDVER